jgi:hypothetical protein
MPAVTVSILGVIEDQGFPQMVECELFDRFGAAWRFIEKLPVIENSTLESALYPRPGTIACEVIQTGQDDHGRSFLLVDTQRPWACSQPMRSPCLRSLPSNWRSRKAKALS